MQSLKDIIKHVNHLKNKTAVIKLPSCVILDEAKLEEFTENLTVLSECGLKINIVHDFKNLLSIKAEEFGLNYDDYLSKCLPDKAIGIYEMILAGHVNKHLVTKFNLSGIRSVGISGKDGHMVVTKNIRKLKATNDLTDPYISEPTMILPEILLELNDALIVPLISPIACSENGSTSVVEVDKLIAMLAVSIEADYVIYMDETFDSITKNIKVKYKDSLHSRWPQTSSNINLFKAVRYVHEHSAATVCLSSTQVENALFSSLFE